MNLVRVSATLLWIWHLRQSIDKLVCLTMEIGTQLKSKSCDSENIKNKYEEKTTSFQLKTRL